MIPRSSPHRYEEIAGEIRSSIRKGAYGVEGRLPSERWLGQSFNAHRNTIRQALGLLEREGIVHSVGKSGWFVPNQVSALSTRTSEDNRVMLVTFRRRSGTTIDSLAQGLHDVLASGGVQMLRYDSAGPRDAQHVATIEQLTAVHAGGIVMWPHSSIDTNLLERLRDTGAMVMVDRRVFGFECDCVIFDDLQAGRTITQHLLAQGHRRIAFLGDEPFVESVLERCHGYRLALEERGITPDENLIVLTYGVHEPTFSGNIDILLELPDPPTAIVCSNDSVASALMLILRARNVQIPESIAVTGFGNDAAGYLDVMGLTTMEQPFVDLGRAAGRLLLERLSEPTSLKGSEYRKILVPMNLVVRQSSRRMIS